MPQMMPINWIFSFIFFILIFIIFNIMNFYIYKYSSKKKMTFHKKINKNFFWKW